MGTPTHSRVGSRLFMSMLAIGAALWGIMPSAVAGDRPDIHTFSASQQAVLYGLMTDYITTAIVNEHVNPPPGAHGSWRFLVWHRNYIKGMEDYLISRNHPEFVPLPKWDPGSPIPNAFFVGGGVDPDCPGLCPPLVTQNPQRPLPSSLRLPGLCAQLGNFRSTLENYHNGIHPAVGGVMGGFRSPGAPIFWLWHAFVDDVWFEWQCDCGRSEGTAFDIYPAVERITDLQAGIADAWMRDSDEDVGSEPNTETVLPYLSKDIWVRNARATRVGPTGWGTTRYLNEHQHENPEYSPVPALTPYVYVKVRNRGCTTVSGRVRLYYTNASLGGVWGPTHFTEVVSSLPIENVVLPAGSEHVVEFRWENIPAPTPAAGDHFCLVARFEADPASADPINGEMLGVSVAESVKNSNQFVWKNLTIVDNFMKRFDVFARGVSPDAGFLRLEFVVPPDARTRNTDDFFGHGRIEFEMPPILFQRWMDAGGIGQGIEVDPLRGTVSPLRAGATIENLPVAFGEEFLLGLRFEEVLAPCESDRTAFDLHLVAFDGQTLLGGMQYEIRPTSFRSNPVASVASDGPRINCTGSPLVLRAESASPAEVAGYQWFRDGSRLVGAVERSFTATRSGGYSVVIAYRNGCNRMSAELPVVIGLPPHNDDACAAMPLALGQMAHFNLYCATAQPREASPGVGTGPDSCKSRDGWCESDPDVQNSVWYSFVAPPSGVVTIRTDFHHGAGHGHPHDHTHAMNPQLAVWSTAECQDFGGYRLMAANDDSSDVGMWGTSPALEDLDGLEPGREYLIQVDGFEGGLGMGTLIVEASEPPCYADCDDSGSLDIFDFLCFQNQFLRGDPLADCDGSGALDTFDFLCFISAFDAGCE